MEIIIWLGIAVLACVGATRIIGLAFCRFPTPANMPQGYYILPISSDNDHLEIQLRHYLRYRSWNGLPVAVIILPERELDDIGIKIFERMTQNTFGVFLCYPWELEKTIKNLR